MRFRSTVESVENNEISFSAIIETILAVSASLLFAYKTGIFIYIICGAIIAPLLLLRTPFSIEMSYRMFAFMALPVWNLLDGIIDNIIGYGNNFKDNVYFALLVKLPVISILFVCVFLNVGFFAICSRIFATVVAFFMHPVNSVASIPHNWARVNLSTDLSYPPELLPEFELNGTKLLCNKYKIPSDLMWSNFMTLFKRKEFDENWVVQVIFILAFFPVITTFIFIKSPSIIYRLSLKSTSIIYLPLLWIIGKKVPAGMILKDYIEEIIGSQYEQLKRIYAWIVMIFLTLMPLFVLFALETVDRTFRGEEIAGYFFPLAEISSWHITRFISALLTLALYYWSDNIYLRIQKGIEYEKQYYRGSVNAIKIIRTMATMWTLGCGLYLLYSNFDWSTLPTIRWFPFN